MGRELLTAGVAGAVAALVVSAGAELAFAQGAGPVNPHPTSPAVTAPGSFADIIDRVAPAVVSIEVERPPAAADQEAKALRDELQRMFPGLRGAPEGRGAPLRVAGSGFFVSGDGFVVTNNHVVEGGGKVTVRLRDDRTLPARLVGRDPATDLAVLKVDGGPFPFVDFEDRAKPRVGDWVVALGNPFGLGGTATAGIVSALRRPNISGSSYVDYLQIDAPINRGNSGGPTFDLYGRVVGVNAAIFSPSGGSVGIGFDIPADVAARVVRQLIAHGQVVRGYIGATVQDLTPEVAASLGLKPHTGALVAEVVPGGPAARAGLASGDIVRNVNGKPVASAAELTRAVAAAAPGEPVRLEGLRAGRPLTLSVTLAARPAEAPLAGAGAGAATPPATPGDLGLLLGPTPGGGARIVQVEPGSPAAAKGLAAGDVILRAGGRRVGAPADVAVAVARARTEHRKAVLLLVGRQGRQLFVALDLSDKRK